MSWVKVDDSFWSAPKVEASSLAAVGAFVRVLSYCGQHLTDGEIGEAAALYCAGGKRTILRELVERRFLVENGDGFTIPDYLAFNPSRDDVEAKRLARAEAGRKGGLASKPRSKR